MKTIIILLSLVILPISAPAQWFDRQSLGCTVLIEKRQDTLFEPLGTGFVLWNYANVKHPFVVTAGHLLRRSELYVSVNADSFLVSLARHAHSDTIQFDQLNWVLSGSRLRARVKLSDSSGMAYLLDVENDVGLFLVDLPTRGLTEKGDTVRYTQAQAIPESKIHYHRDVALGDECYFVGFPFGLGVGDQLEPIVRSVSVAWQSPSSQMFLLDAFSYGGNSGSPVFTKIQLGREWGQLKWDDAFLVGIITGHLGQGDQNWGLAICRWIDVIRPLVKEAGALKIME